MTENILKLKTQFDIIKNKGWIESISNSTGSVGITFEYYLGKKQDNSFLPDFHDIELKCSTYTSSCPITLFSMSFDGPNLYEFNRIITKYGYYDSLFKSQKIIYASLSTNKQYLVNNKYYFSLEIDKINKIIFLVVKDINNETLEKQSYIKFDSIKNHLYKKLKYLALIYAFKKNENNKKYFKYYILLLYKIKSFDVFLNLLEKQIIKVTIRSKINKSKLHYGKVSNKNIVFSINKYNLKYLFDKIE